MTTTFPATMKALSIRQPWAHAIIHMGKDIENRKWATEHRGPLLIHASKTPDQWRLGEWSAAKRVDPEQLQYGGIIGIVDLVDCVTASSSSWFYGPYGFVLANPRPLRFHECRGQLGLFEVCYGYWG